MKRLGFYIAIGMLLGSSAVFLSPLWLSAILLLSIAILLFNKNALMLILVVMLSAGFGFISAKEAVIRFLPSGPIELEGSLKAVSLLDQQEYYFIGKHGGRPVKLLIKDQQGKALLKTSDNSLAGKGVRILGQVEIIPQATNPNGFNYKNYLIGKGCQGCVRIERLEFNPNLDDPVEVQRVAMGRRWLASVYKSTAWQQGDLAIGILLGEDQRIDEAVRSDYQITGTTHILTVSGVHFGILILCVNFLLNRLEIPYLIKKTILLLLVTFMLWIIGWDTAAFRAFWMLILLELTMMLFAQPDAFHALCWTVVLLSVQTPGILPNVSFQLSIAALVGLILVFPFFYPRKKVLSWIERRGRSGDSAHEGQGGQKVSVRLLFFFEKHLLAPLVASLSVTMTMAPLLIYTFNSLSLSSLFYNIPVAWISAMALPILAVIGPLSIWPPLALAAGIPAGVLLKLMSLCVATAKAWHWLPLNLSVMSFGLICLSYTCLSFIAACRQNGGFFRHQRLTAAIVLFIILFVGISYASKPSDKPYAEICYFDVGQGDGAVFKLQNGETLVIDTGKLKKRGGMDEILLKAGVDRIDTLIITHFHDDHMGQYEQVFERLSIGQIGVYAEGENSQSPMFKAFVEAARTKKIAIKGLHAGKSLGAYQVLWPPAGFRTQDLNDGSLVGIVSVGKINFLMTGDMTSKVEYDIMRRVSERADQETTRSKWVLKVPHHGSKHSSSPEVIAMEGLESAVVSVGVNFYRHPSKSVVEQYEHRLRDDFFRTDRQGYVHYMTDGNRLYVNQKGDKHGVSRVN